ncbi:MAG: cyclic nucleotide-binding domain-containing protein [Actinomycetota bacterium]
MVESKTLPDKLRGIPLFAHLDPSALETVAGTVTEFNVPPGQLLVQPNTEATGLFLIEEGTALVELRGGKTFELGPGEFVGELALLNEGAVRNARVRAKTEMVCLAIRRNEFLGMLHMQPTIAVAMLRTLARRLTETDAELGRLRASQ